MNKLQQSAPRNMSVTPQKVIHRSSSSLHFSPLENCINLPLAQNQNLPKSYFYKPKEIENHGTYPIMVAQRQAKKSTQTPEKNTNENITSNNYKTNSSVTSSDIKTETNINGFNGLSMKDRGRIAGFDINVMKEMQVKFKKLLEENEKLKCSLIQKNKYEEENVMNQQIALRQISDLESQLHEYKQENIGLQNQLDGFKRQNESNIKLLQETEDKMVNYLKLMENGKSATKTLTFENFNLRKNNEEISLKLTNFQNKVKQDSIQLQKYEETIAKLNKDQECLINSWSIKYSELQQSFVLEKNLHQQSEKSLKLKIQNLEEEFKTLNEKFNETNENMMKLHVEMNNEKEKNQILEYKFKENQNDLANFQEIEGKVLLIKQDNEKLTDLVSHMKKDKDLYEKELFYKQNELKNMSSELDEYKKQSEELKNELDFYKDNHEQSEKIKKSLENEIMTQKEEIHELINLNETWENKINMVISETERLSGVIREKDQDIENLQEEYHGLKSKFANLQRIYENSDKDFKVTLSSNAENLKKLGELENKFNENQRIREQLESDKKAIIHFYEDNRVRIDRELEGYKGKYHNILKELEECSIRFEDFKTLKFDDKSLQIKFQAEKSTFETEIFQLKNKITEYEIAYNALLKKTEDLHNRNNENHTERENLQKETSEQIESLEQGNKDLSVYVDRLKNALFEKEEMILKLDNGKKKYEGQVKELKEIIQINKEEIDQLYSLNNQKNNGSENLRLEMERIHKENNNLLKENKEMKKFVNKFKEEENNYKRTIEILTNTSKDYKLQIDHFAGELNQKNKELIEKIEDLDKMKDNYGTCMEKLQMLETKLLNKLQLK